MYAKGSYSVSTTDSFLVDEAAGSDAAKAKTKLGGSGLDELDLEVESVEEEYLWELESEYIE